LNERRWIIGASGGAVTLGTLAVAFGACCIAPWAVSLLGVAGAITLARWAFLQPYVIAALAALLGVAFWLAYRRQPACGFCEQATQRHLRWVVWIATVTAVLLAGGSYVPMFLTI